MLKGMVFISHNWSGIAVCSYENGTRSMMVLSTSDWQFSVLIKGVDRLQTWLRTQWLHRQQAQVEHKVSPLKRPK